MEGKTFSQLTKYEQSRMRTDRTCAWCNKPIFDFDYRIYTKQKLGKRTFYNFYHTRCYAQMKDYERWCSNEEE